MLRIALKVLFRGEKCYEVTRTCEMLQCQALGQNQGKTYGYTFWAKFGQNLIYFIAMILDTCKEFGVFFNSKSLYREKFVEGRV